MNVYIFRLCIYMYDANDIVHRVIRSQYLYTYSVCTYFTSSRIIQLLLLRFAERCLTENLLPLCLLVKPIKVLHLLSLSLSHFFLSFFLFLESLDSRLISLHEVYSLRIIRNTYMTPY